MGLKFGLITPAFDSDGCLQSLELLYRDIQRQRYNNLEWMICSNGFSEKLLAFVERGNRYLESCGHFPKDTFRFFSRSKDRKKLLYLHTEFEGCNNTVELLANIAKRRNLCIDMTSADYVFMLDADAKLLDVKMFKEINRKLEKTHRAMRMYKTLHEIGVLPVFPIGYARIDQLNFSVKAELAKKVRYPHNSG